VSVRVGVVAVVPAADARSGLAAERQAL
jgi:hypothetical protein